jgi:hypothetical protein
VKIPTAAHPRLTGWAAAPRDGTKACGESPERRARGDLRAKCRRKVGDVDRGQRPESSSMKKKVDRCVADIDDPRKCQPAVGLQGGPDGESRKGSVQKSEAPAPSHEGSLVSRLGPSTSNRKHHKRQAWLAAHGPSRSESATNRETDGSSCGLLSPRFQPSGRADLSSSLQATGYRESGCPLPWTV